MIDHIFSLICNSSVIDSETNTVSIHNILEKLTVFTNSENLAINLPIQFEVFSDWTRTDENIPTRGRLRAGLRTPTNENRKLSELEIDLTTVTYYRTRIRAIGIQLTGPGRYKIEIEFQQENTSKWKKVASLPMLVVYRKPEPDAK